MKRNYFSILFFIRKTKLLKNGEAPICLRITVNGQRTEVQIKRSVEVDKWSAAKECHTGRGEKARELNHYLETVRTKILRIHRELEQDDKPITANILMNHFNGINTPPKMLLEVFKEHNAKCKELIGIDYVKDTVARYERAATYLFEFMQAKYNIKDIPLKELTPLFIADFEHFLKTVKKCQPNSAIKYLKNLKHLILQAIENKWIDTNPFAGKRFKHTKTNRDFLPEADLIKIITQEITDKDFRIIRDIFVFCCFTDVA